MTHRDVGRGTPPTGAKKLTKKLQKGFQTVVFVKWGRVEEMKRMVAWPVTYFSNLKTQIRTKTHEQVRTSRGLVTFAVVDESSDGELKKEQIVHPKCFIASTSNRGRINFVLDSGANEFM